MFTYGHSSSIILGIFLICTGYPAFCQGDSAVNLLRTVYSRLRLFLSLPPAIQLEVYLCVQLPYTLKLHDELHRAS